MTLDSYDGIVYDLDGTLVSLDVDWGQARADTASTLRDRGIDDDGQTLWELLERSIAEGFEAVVEQKLSEHEREGARTSTVLPASQALPHDVPTGVCSLNCEAACRLALEVHCLDTDVDAVVGRDTVDTKKPEPEPLLETLERLSVEPENAIFVGDSNRDARTAERAGVDFTFVEDVLDSRSL